jgi:hypothetical protein
MRLHRRLDKLEQAHKIDVCPVCQGSRLPRFVVLNQGDPAPDASCPGCGEGLRVFVYMPRRPDGTPFEGRLPIPPSSLWVAPQPGRRAGRGRRSKTRGLR